MGSGWLTIVQREMLLNHDDLENIVMSVNARMSIMGAQ